MSVWAGHDLLAAQAVDFQVREEVAALVRETDELLQKADVVESWRHDERHDIDDAHARGLTVDEFRDQVEAAVAWYESAEGQAQMYEDHMERVAEEHFENLADDAAGAAGGDPWGPGFLGDVEAGTPAAIRAESYGSEIHTADDGLTF